MVESLQLHYYAMSPLRCIFRRMILTSCCCCYKNAGNRGKEGYNPAVVSLFGTDEKPVNNGQPGNRGREGYDPSHVSLFGNEKK